jgi:cellulose synthase/poly-beta-1,6-N-acetylglucosamine synthase-like glycosyltransferase
VSSPYRDTGVGASAIVKHYEGAGLARRSLRHLPTPPSDDELYAYFGSQRRWVLLCMTVAFAVASMSLLRFAGQSPALYIFFAVLGLNATGSAVSLCSSQNRRRVTRADHELRVSSWRRADHCSVDVFLPTAGEAMAVLLNTYQYVARMRWPGRLQVHVLDDSARDEVRAAAVMHGFKYLTRNDRGHLKKAGNLRFGFNQTGGDYVVVFDADFCPRADFLLHLAPYMDAPDVGIVQSPQCFDTSPTMGWLQRTAGATQELFYRWVQPSRDAAGAPICVGTNALYRRKALSEAGGFAPIEHSEDVHTGVNLLKVGYHTQYVPTLLAKGLCPDDLASFMNQQYRWCAGSMSLLRSREFRRMPLTWRQRACFWSGFLYYISTAINVFAIHVPGLVMAFVYPSHVQPSHFIPFLAPAWIWLVLLPATFRTRWRYDVLRVQLVYSFCHAVAIYDTLRGRTASWVPTGSIRRRSRLARTIGQVALVCLTLTTAGLWLGLGLDVHRYGWQRFWLMGIFILGYSYLTVPLIRDLSHILFERVSPLAGGKQSNQVIDLRDSMRSGQAITITDDRR